MKNYITEKLVPEDMKMGNEIDHLMVQKEKNMKSFD